jgi:protein Mpv17
MFFGFAIHAPLSHVHFNLLEWMTVKGGFTGLSIPVFKTIMGQVRDNIVLVNRSCVLDRLAFLNEIIFLTESFYVLQFVYWSWISNSLYHGAMGAMQGKSFQQIYDRIADVIWDTQKRQWVFWIPVQLLSK